MTTSQKHGKNAKSLGDSHRGFRIADLSPRQELKRHPPGLAPLVSAEVWERFSYYGMRAILLLYLTKGIGMDRPDALELTAIFAAGVYLAPLAGSYFADRRLGQYKAVIIGAILMVLGHFALAFPELLIWALALIACGNGFFKPCAAVLVGDLYPSNATNLRERAYTLYYVGINAGAFLAPLVCGTLAETTGLGWHWGFGAAGIGMVFGLAVLLSNHRKVVTHQHSMGFGGLAPRDWGEVFLWVMAVAAFSWMLPFIWANSSVSVWIGTVVVIAAGYSYRRWANGRLRKQSTGSQIDFDAASQHCHLSVDEVQRVVVIFILTFFSVILWTGLEQAGGTMTLFADEKTDLRIFGWQFPAAYLQSVNPLVIILLAYPLALFWTWLDRRANVSAAAKQSLGLIVAGLGFALMAAAEWQAAEVSPAKVSPMWLFVVYVVLTFGEMMSYPVGLTLVNTISPRAYRSRMMAVWLAGSAIAGYAAGMLEAWLVKLGAWITVPQLLCVAMIAAGGSLLVVAPALTRMSASPNHDE